MLLDSRCFSTGLALPDTALDRLVRAWIRQHPNASYRLQAYIICTQGARVQESRVRASLRRVVPVGL